MSEMTKSEENGVVEEGGIVEGWPPIIPRNRAKGNRIQMAFKKFRAEILERLRTLDVDQESEGCETIEIWKPIRDEPR